jgi:hypothetical protein
MGRRPRRVTGRKVDPFGGKRDPTTQLLRAVTRYIESRGGTVAVIGGIEIQEWPEDRSMIYRLAVKFLGRKPKPPEAEA